LNRPFIIAAIGIVVVAVAIALNFMPGAPDEEASRPAVTEKARKATPTSPVAEETAAPSFDVVRINPNGDSVMAGRAAASSTVRILDNGTEIGSVKTDNRGEWVFVPDQPMRPGKHRLNLDMSIDGKAPTRSSSEVVLVVPEHGKDIAGQAGNGRTLALKIGPDGKATVMQSPGRGSGGALSVDAVDYDENGQLFISGRAKPGGTVQLYLNNRFIGHARAGADDGSGGGVWTMSPENPVAPGLYTLRADHVDNAGKVLARVEFPFSRAGPIDKTAMKKGDYVIVQPGNSLWRLARSSYGAGTRYTVIYQANKEQIANPDLIYPGQRFKLPDNN